MADQKVVMTLNRAAFRDTREKVKSDAGQEFAKNSAEKRMAGGAPLSNMPHRPTHGVITFQDNMQSSVAVMTRSGVPVKKLVNQIGSGVEYGSYNAQRHETTVSRELQDANRNSGVLNDYFLTRAAFSSVEKSQVIDTFGESYVYFYGDKTDILRCDGYLLNTRDFPWYHEWIYNWENVLRGTRLLEMDARAYINIGLVIYEGYFLDYNVVQIAEDEVKVPFHFDFIVTDVISAAEPLFTDWEARVLAGEYEGHDPRVKKSVGDKLAEGIAGGLMKTGMQIMKDPFSMSGANLWRLMAVNVGGAMYSAMAGELLFGDVTVGNFFGDLSAIGGGAMSAARSGDWQGLWRNSAGLAGGVFDSFSIGRSGFESGGLATVKKLGKQSTVGYGSDANIPSKANY